MLPSNRFVYHRDIFAASSISESQVPSLENPKSEFLCLFFRELFLVLIAVYHPFWNDSTANQEAMTVITDVVDYAFLTHGSEVRIILCGDFNDLRNQFSDISLLTNLTPVVNFKTRGENTLDQIFVNFAHDKRATSLPPLAGSDHCVISWAPSFSPKPQVFKKEVRNFSSANIARFRESVSEFDWLSMVKSSGDLNDSVSVFVGALNALVDLHFPARVIRVRTSDPPWMKASLKLLIDDRDRAYRDGNWAKYRRLRSETIRHVSKLKQMFLDRAASSSNSKKLWSSIRNVSRCSRTSFRSQISAEDFSLFFKSNFQMCPSHDSSDCCSEPSFINRLGSVPGHFVLTIDETLNQIRRLKCGSCGPDGLSPWFVKLCAWSLAPAITFLFNRSLEISDFPVCLKRANVTPIPKCDRAVEVSDFRPISILPCLSKLFEKLVLKKWILPCVRDKIDVSQFAYISRPGAGTISAVTILYHKILEFLDYKSGAVRILAIDFAKAFDKITHSSIINACVSFEINPHLVKWLESFLTDRFQRVNIQGSFSDWSPVCSGVPQGSVLGPVLFCLVLNDLSPIFSNSHMIKYADDVVLMHFVRSPYDDQLQSEWNAIVNWSENISLPINFDKCNVLNVVTNKSLSLSPISVSQTNFLRSVQSIVFLGVVLSDDLKWNCHFDRILKKAAKRIYILRNLRRSGCSEDVLWRVYISMVRPVLTYAAPSFCNAPDYLWGSLLRFERRLWRIMGIKRDELLNAQDFMNMSCEALFSKIHENADHSMRCLFLPQCSRLSRSRLLLRPPFARTKRFQNSFIRYCK